ncbi:MAG: hypothetical protein WA174_09020 [Rhodoferax sp.]
MRAFSCFFIPFVPGVVLLCLVLQARGEPLLAATAFGMSEPQLLSTLPDVQRLHRPLPGPGGSRGLWALPRTTVAQHPFETVFYFRNRQLQRIEQTWVSSAQPCNARAVFADVTRDVQTRYGASVLQGSDTPSTETGQTVLWVAEDTDLLAILQDSGTRCAVRLVNKPRNLKDDSEL